MKNKFKKGLILGGLLTAAAAVGFVMSSGGQKLSEEVHKDLKTLAKHLKKKLHQMKDITKESYDELVATVVEEYSKTKGLASNDKKLLITALQAKWHEMEKEYFIEKDEVQTKK